VIVVAALATWFAAGYSIWYYTFRPGYYEELASLWVVVALPLTLFLIGGGFLIWACSDNIYRINTGTVVAHDFTPAHRTPTTFIYSSNVVMPIQGQWIEDDWAIQIEDENGRTGWLHFDSPDIFELYPLGSRYFTPEQGETS
jgi:hypothetical protein